MHKPRPAPIYQSMGWNDSRVIPGFNFKNFGSVFSPAQAEERLSPQGLRRRRFRRGLYFRRPGGPLYSAYCHGGAD